MKEDILLLLQLYLGSYQMAPVLSRSLATASLASLPISSPFTARNPNGVFNLRSAFVPQNVLRRKGLSCNGLKWQLERRNNRVSVRCEATVAEKEETDTSGEKFEYQAEVGFRSISINLGFCEGLWTLWFLIANG